MAENSEISWTTHTFNIVWGCTKVSEACKNCYADTLSTRYGKDLWGADKPRQIMSESYWKQPLKWEKEAAASGVRARVFCSSMADVFEDHPTVASQRLRLWDLIERTPHLDWLLLTKRADKMIAFAPRSWAHEWPENVWAGVTVENQMRAEERIWHLLRVPSRVRFLSMEPLLGPVDLSRWLTPGQHISHCTSCYAENDPQDEDRCPECGEEGTLIDTWGEEQAERMRTGERYEEGNGFGWRDVEGKGEIDWIIAGGESGPGARPMQVEWVRQIREQAARFRVPFHFKQWGEHGPDLVRLGKKAAGYLLDGVEHRAFPQAER